MRHSKWISLLAAFLLAATAGVAADSDDEAANTIRHELMDENIRGVEVEVDGERVVLTGEVESLWAKTKASELALDHDHVDSVDNRIQIRGDANDQMIADDVASRLRNYVHYSIYDDVEVEVKDSVVTLHGKVTWGFKSQEMERLASRVPGVSKVDNEIELLPASPNDQQLRNAIASRIYGDSLFTRYAIQPTPPIHVIVENGHVTLKGYVQSKIEKRRAGIIARRAFGVFSVANELRIENAGAS